jgi:hypothetical protein
MPEEKQAEEATSQQTPTTNSDLGRFTSLEKKQNSLANLKAPFKVGHPALPGGGRPKQDGPETKELRKLLHARFPNDPQGRSYLRLVVEGVVKSAIKGNTYAADLIFFLIDCCLGMPFKGDLPRNHCHPKSMNNTTRNIKIPPRTSRRHDPVLNLC